MLGLVRSCCVTYLRTVRMACLLLSKEGMRLRCQAGFQPSTDFSCMKKILIGFLVVLNYGLLSARHRLISVEFSKQFLLPVLVIKGLLLLLFEPAGRAESGLSLICRQEGSTSSAVVPRSAASTVLLCSGPGIGGERRSWSKMLVTDCILSPHSSSSWNRNGAFEDRSFVVESLTFSPVLPISSAGPFIQRPSDSRICMIQSS